MTLSVHSKSLSTSIQYFNKSFILISWTLYCPSPNRSTNPANLDAASSALSSSFAVFYVFVPRAKPVITTSGFTDG